MHDHSAMNPSEFPKTVFPELFSTDFRCQGKKRPRASNQVKFTLLRDTVYLLSTCVTNHVQPDAETLDLYVDYSKKVYDSNVKYERDPNYKSNIPGVYSYYDDHVNHRMGVYTFSESNPICKDIPSFLEESLKKDVSKWKFGVCGTVPTHNQQTKDDVLLLCFQIGETQFKALAVITVDDDLAKVKLEVNNKAKPVIHNCFRKADEEADKNTEKKRRLEAKFTKSLNFGSQG